MAKHQSCRAVLSVESLEDRRVAAVDAFIWFESPPGDGMQEVRGETKDDVYLGNKSAAFEIKDFSFGVENPTTIGSATGGAGAGKIKFNEFTIKKTSDSASPAFFQDPSRPSDEGPEESITFVYGG
jgi:type VI protein secretion system component Hcp